MSYEKRRKEGNLLFKFNPPGSAQEIEDMIQFHTEMKQAGIKPNRHIYNTIISALAESNSITQLPEFLKLMSQDGLIQQLSIQSLCKIKTTLKDDRNLESNEKTRNQTK